MSVHTTISVHRKSEVAFVSGEISGNQVCRLEVWAPKSFFGRIKHEEWRELIHEAEKEAERIIKDNLKRWGYADE